LLFLKTDFDIFVTVYQCSSHLPLPFPKNPWGIWIGIILHWILKTIRREFSTLWYWIFIVLNFLPFLYFVFASSQYSTALWRALICLLSDFPPGIYLFSGISEKVC
jgi:hypothetical protein